MILPTRPHSDRRPPRDIPMPGGLPQGLARGRVHEFCGPARVTLALMLLAQTQGPVIWIMPAWLPERPYACGIQTFLHPGRLIFARVRRPDDMQWAMEEALRSGAAPVVLADMPAPPGLTPVRRLHLAAEAGGTLAHHAGRPAPLGLLLSPAEGGAQGVDSRWSLAPAPSPSTLIPDSGLHWRLDLLRARSTPPTHWTLTQSATGTIQTA